MKTEELFQIWDRFETSQIAEIVYETADSRLCLKRYNDGTINSDPSTIRTEEKKTAAPLGQEASAPSAAIHEIMVKAPFVGTFYRASAPGERPFVRIGQTVKKGETLGIIEAMKMMNEITAPCDGIVQNIFTEDESLVEYDQPLMSIGVENV